MIAGCDEAREAVERWADNVCPDVGNTRRCTYMVNPCISLCPSSPNGGKCERMCADNKLPNQKSSRDGGNFLACTYSYRMVDLLILPYLK